MDQNFGHKELYEVVLRAKTPMQFGSRKIEIDEPVLYFSNVSMSLLSERDNVIMARGGWANMPKVIWDDRSEVQFQMTQGVMSSVGMSILLSSNVTERKDGKPLYVHTKEGPFSRDSIITLDIEGENKTGFYVQHRPILPPIKKAFIFEYDRKAIQAKRYGKLYVLHEGENFEQYFIALKNFEEPVDIGRNYVMDYYYEYRDEALFYTVQKERFNGLFTLEGKFYSKDENEGFNYTNIIYMPKVRVVSDINLRLGERADPTVSTFNIIGLPETVGDRKNLILEITRLGQDIDDTI